MSAKKSKFLLLWKYNLKISDISVLKKNLYMKKKKITFLFICPLRHWGGAKGLSEHAAKKVFFWTAPLTTVQIVLFRAREDR